MNKIILLATAALSAPLLAQQPMQSPPPAMSDVFMQRMDFDKNGKVSKEEFLKPYEAQFAHMDKNKDGSIDRAEIDAFDAEVRQRMQQMKQQTK